MLNRILALVTSLVVFSPVSGQEPTPYGSPISLEQARKYMRVSGNSLNTGTSRGYVGYAENDHITLTGGPKDGNACQGRHVFGDIGQDGNSAVSTSGTPMSQNGPR